jgi:hypothetical protein
VEAYSFNQIGDEVLLRRVANMPHDRRRDVLDAVHPQHLW